MLLTTPMTIRTLQRKLYAKAKPEIGACLGVKNIGKPCAGKPLQRFDEGGQARACSLSTGAPLDPAALSWNQATQAKAVNYRFASIELTLERFTLSESEMLDQPLFFQSKNL